MIYDYDGKSSLSPFLKRVIINARENIVLLLKPPEEIFIQPVIHQLLVELREIEDVFLRALHGVWHHGPGMHDESPVA